MVDVYNVCMRTTLWYKGVALHFTLEVASILLFSRTSAYHSNMLYNLVISAYVYSTDYSLTKVQSLNAIS